MLANKAWVAAPVLLWLAGCTGDHTIAPVAGEAPPGSVAASRAGAAADKVAAARRSATAHRVVRGDTLYSIAFQYDLDYRDIARWNRIGDPYLIIVGQHLRLTPPPLDAAPAASPEQSAVSQGVSPADQAAQPAPDAARPPSNRQTTTLRWQWPTRGRVIKRFSAKRLGKKGIMIAGDPGQPVAAAAAGTVVYAGSGLVGYGRLVIVKHAQEFLSAYAHNRKLLVQEGDAVKRGQVIAEMGSTGTSRPSLHFEIRRHGKPIDPLPLLPKRAR